MQSDLRPVPPLHARAPIGVLVVDDQTAVREGLARLISCSSVPLRGIRVAANGAEALAAARQFRPEVIVLDVDLGGEDGLALIPQLPPGTGVLVLTSHGDAKTRSRATWLGAHAFVEKHRPAAELLEAIAALGATRSRGEAAPSHGGASSLPGSSASSDVPPRGPP